MRKAVYLDRDNTIIVDKIYLNDPDAIEYLPNSAEGLKAMQDLGFEIIIVTNQSGVPRGLVTLENLHEIHRRIKEHYKTHGVEILDFYYAPHMTDSDHPLRKPNPGMLLEGKKDHEIDLDNSWMIGDRMTDVVAGHRAGCKSIFVHGTEEPDSTYEKEFFVVNDLVEAAEIIKTKSR